MLPFTCFKTAERCHLLCSCEEMACVTDSSYSDFCSYPDYLIFSWLRKGVAWRTFARHNEWQLCTCCSWTWYLQVSPRYFPMMFSTGHMRTSGLDHRTYTVFTQLVMRHLLDLKLSWGPALIKRVAHTFYGVGTVLGDFHVLTHIFWMQRFYSEWS